MRIINVRSQHTNPPCTAMLKYSLFRCLFMIELVTDAVRFAFVKVHQRHAGWT
jgi:hypothetical protein